MHNNKKIYHFLGLALLLILVAGITAGCGQKNSDDQQNGDDLSTESQDLSADTNSGDSIIPLDLGASTTADSSTSSTVSATTSSSTDNLESQDVDLEQETKMLDKSFNSITGKEFDGTDLADKNFQ
ncbi:MAG: hypothetical protein WC516_01240 [Patescibacteria group bacterium]